MGSVGLTLVGLLLFLCLYRAPHSEETPLLPESRHTESVTEEPKLAKGSKGMKNRLM